MTPTSRRLMWQLRVAMTCVAALGVACYAAGAPAARSIWIVAYLAVAAVSAASIRRLPRLPLWGEGILAVVLWIGIALEVWRTGNAFEAASNMLAVVQGLLAPRADGRWHRVAVGAGVGAHLAAASLLEIDATGAALATVLMLALLVAAGWALRLWHLERTAHAWSAGGSVTASEAIRAQGAGRGGLLGILGVAVAAVVLAGGAFVTLPRPGEGGPVGNGFNADALPRPPRGPGSPRGKATLTGHGGRRTGFHDQVDFSNLGPIKRDPRIALMVRTLDMQSRPAVLGGPLKLRGAAFNRYANRAWSSSGVRARTHRDADDGRTDGRVALRAPERDAQVWQHDVERIQLTAPYVFHSGQLLAVSVPALILDGNDTAALATEAPATIRVWAAPSQPDPKVLVRDTVTRTPAFADPIWTARDQTQLLDTVRIAIAGNEHDPYRLAKRLELGLRRRFRYTLDVTRPPRGREPLEVFLTGEAAGHCEYFATAMVLLLRSQGVPSRLVVGYRSPEHDPETGLTTIRHSHAHAWVEVRFDQSGWVPFDPTPADSAATDGSTVPVPATPGADGAPLGDGFDGAGGAAWFDSLLEFDAAERATVLAQVGGVGGVAALTVLLLALGWLAWRGWRRYGGGAPGSAAARPAVLARPPPDFYRSLLRVLGQAGFVRPRSMTPRELARWVRHADGPAPDAVDKITVTFERLRFGGGGRVSSETARTLRELVEKVADDAQRPGL